MKVGMRAPSIKKSVSARTTGKFNRAVKSSINPLYGKKGMGWINDPKRAAYNKVYNKTTFSVVDNLELIIILITLGILLLLGIFIFTVL
ncbi:hypothetical protein [Clostridium baratii]|uniref:hypothetical protein n=1 Tax=Clostridium baratii TaxID=1561 RepID=UPI003D339199